MLSLRGCVCAQVILELALGAVGEDRSPVVAMVYDDLLRKEVETKCGQLGSSFELKEKFLTIDPIIERRAVRCECVSCQCMWRCMCPLIRELNLMPSNRLCGSSSLKPKAEEPTSSGKGGGKRKSPSEAICYKCGQPGHLAYQCRNNKARKAVKSE